MQVKLTMLQIKPLITQKKLELLTLHWTKYNSLRWINSAFLRYKSRKYMYDTILTSMVRILY